jgi:hypothetical protein
MTEIRGELDILVRRYAEAAATHGRATEAGDHKKANRAFSAKMTLQQWREGRLQFP